MVALHPSLLDQAMLRLVEKPLITKLCAAAHTDPSFPLYYFRFTRYLLLALKYSRDQQCLFAKIHWIADIISKENQKQSVGWNKFNSHSVRVYDMDSR
jgi:hypothetical protein